MHARIRNCMQPLLERKAFPVAVSAALSFPIDRLSAGRGPQQLVRGAKAAGLVRAAAWARPAAPITAREPLGRLEVWREVWALIGAESHQRGLGYPRWACGEDNDCWAGSGGATPASSRAPCPPFPFSLPPSILVAFLFSSPSANSTSLLALAAVRI